MSQMDQRMSGWTDSPTDTARWRVVCPRLRDGLICYAFLTDDRSEIDEESFQFNLFPHLQIKYVPAFLLQNINSKFMTREPEKLYELQVTVSECSLLASYWSTKMYHIRKKICLWLFDLIFSMSLNFLLTSPIGQRCILTVSLRVLT